MPSSDFRRALAVLRSESPAGERALAAAFLAAEFLQNGKIEAENPRAEDAAARMFGYNARHDQACPWDGRGARSGTITYAGEDRIEQYVGQSLWVVYEPGIFADALPTVGDQVRVAPRNGSVAVERIGPNRLGSNGGRSAASGMVVARKTPLAPDEIANAAQLTARRYSASCTFDRDCARVDFSGGAELRIRPEKQAIRLEVSVQTACPDEARDAERALVLCAALLTADGSAATDDAGALLTAERLYTLAACNGMRADWFGFAAAAVQRAYPPEHTRLFEDFAQELLIYVDRDFRPAAVQQVLGQSLARLADAAGRTEDATVPSAMTRVEPGEEASGEWQPLFEFGYKTVRIRIAFVGGEVGWRPDIEALLGKPIPGALAFAIGEMPDAQTGCVDLELRRADAFAAVLAAGFMKGTGAVASDGTGRLFSSGDLLDFALFRRGFRT